MCPLYLKFHAFRGVCCAWKITVENVGHGALYIGRNANITHQLLNYGCASHSVKKAKAKRENISTIVIFLPIFIKNRNNT